jgi:hypothetical protein
MPEADPFASANEAYFIVVAGNMNPAIHHPAWYKVIGALSDEELAAFGLVGGQAQGPVDMPTPKREQRSNLITDTMTMCTPAFAQFTAGKLRITCIEQSWTIATYELSLLPRIRDVASSVFEALAHTPVSAYGLNFNFHRKAGYGNVGARLAQIVDATSLDFLKREQGERSAKIGYTLSEPRRALNVSVEPSVRGVDMIFVGINAHHPIVPSGPGLQQFDLTPLFRDSTDKDLRDAQEILSRVIRAFEGNGRQH